MRATLLLCDSAQEINGKLYILGGGWSVRPVEPLAMMAVAIKLSVGWNQANERLPFELRLVNQDGQPVDPGAGPVVVKGEFEVGRPPGITPGSELDAALALTFALPLGVGAYRWELDVGGERLANEPFAVKPPAAAGR